MCIQQPINLIPAYLCSYDKYGYDKYGYDKYGYDKYGYDKKGYSKGGLYRYEDGKAATAGKAPEHPKQCLHRARRVAGGSDFKAGEGAFGHGLLRDELKVDYALWSAGFSAASIIHPCI